MSDHNKANDLVARLRDGASVCRRDAPKYTGPIRELFESCGAVFIESAVQIEQLSARNKELERLLRYAAVHSSMAEHMNEAWREDSLTALNVPQEKTDGR